VLGVCAVLLLAGAACSSNGDTTRTAATELGTTVGVTNPTVIPADEGAPQSGGSIVFGVDAEPNGLSPVQDQFASNNMLLMSSMLETLTVFDQDGKAQPFLARSITPDATATKWTIALKPDITFQDGQAFDAAAVKTNIDAYRHALASIAMKAISTISVVDPLTVEVDMNQPWASFPSFLASQEGFMESPAAITAADATSHPVGTGPFELVRWDHGSSIVVKKNPHYWQAGKPYLDQIEFRIINDPAARANALRAGDLNLMLTDDPQSIADYRNDSGYKDVIDAAGDTQQVVMNQATAPFDNVDARRALIHATDTHAVADNFGTGVLTPADQPFSAKSAYHQSDPHDAGFDLDAAKRDVAAYTAATGHPPQFNLTVFTGEANVALAQILQAQWKAAGIDAQIDAVDQSTGISQIIVGKTQAELGPNFGYPDPDWNYIFWHSEFTAPVGQLSVNFAHLHLADLDAALKQGRTTLSTDERVHAYQQAIRLMNDDDAYLWLYQYVAALIATNDVHGLGKAEQNGFATIASSGWFGDLWLSH
jgi:ABC-type transport system substrate-binding protein